VELISRTLESHEDWGNEIRQCWNVIHRFFDVRAHPSCSTHVHARPIIGYTLIQLQRVAKAIAYFEPMLREVVPSERKDCVWAQCNTNQPELSSTLTQLYNQCAKSHNFRPLYQWIDCFQSLEQLSNMLSPTKAVSWNFAPTLKPCGTVEFRRPPQTIGADATNHWAAFGLSFIRFALSCDFSEMHAAPTFTHFQDGIRWGAEQLGIQAALRSWQDMRQSVQTHQMTAHEVAEIRLKKLQKRSKYVEKVWGVPEDIIFSQLTNKIRLRALHQAPHSCTLKNSLRRGSERRKA
jgi:Putative amidoligase enzyme